jgi:hypothetical protein
LQLSTEGEITAMETKQKEKMASALGTGEMQNGNSVTCNGGGSSSGNNFEESIHAMHHNEMAIGSGRVGGGNTKSRNATGIAREQARGTGEVQNGTETTGDGNGVTRNGGGSSGGNDFEESIHATCHNETAIGGGDTESMNTIAREQARGTGEVQNGTKTGDGNGATSNGSGSGSDSGIITNATARAQAVGAVENQNSIESGGDSNETALVNNDMAAVVNVPDWMFPDGTTINDYPDSHIEDPPDDMEVQILELDDDGAVHVHMAEPVVRKRRCFSCDARIQKAFEEKAWNVSNFFRPAL